MQGYNCIMVYSQDGSALLFCKRIKAPYQGLYNLVGGKIEQGEDGYEAAYRELTEETGIDRTNIQLHHMMDFTYFNQACYVEVYAGYLKSEVTLLEEVHPLQWMDVNENFFDSKRFAGEGNISHMVEQVNSYGMGLCQDAKVIEGLLKNGICIGVDGCKGGWIAAEIENGQLKLNKYNTLNDIVMSFKHFDEFLIDMVIGLPSHIEHIRPDTYARRIISERTSTIFPAPCRQAVYAKSVAESYSENERVLGKKFTPLTLGIMPKMREIDNFLQENPSFKNRIKESHPEVCFAKLNGKTVLTKKADMDGMEERIKILNRYINLNLYEISKKAKNFNCNVDDIIDAICLAITANFVMQGHYEVIPKTPEVDETGLFMQMIVPK